MNENHEKSKNTLKKLDDLDLPSAFESEKKVEEGVNDMYNQIYGDPADQGT